MKPELPQIVAATDDYLVIYKPEGIAFHAEQPPRESGDGINPNPEDAPQERGAKSAKSGGRGGNKKGGNKEGILQILRRMEDEGKIPRGPRLYPVHRLDQITSGLLVFARGRKNANLLSNEFRHRRVIKYYLALSDRKPKKKQGRVTGDMERGRRSGWILTRTNENPAVTYFLSQSVPGVRPGLRIYLLRPRTGKTHQIRVAMKSLGAPIIGDGLYGRYDLAREEDRAYLHAFALEFRLGDQTVRCIEPPRTGHEFTTPAFQQALKKIGDPFTALTGKG